MKKYRIKAQAGVQNGIQNVDLRDSNVPLWELPSAGIPPMMSNQPGLPYDTAQGSLVRKQSPTIPLHGNAQGDLAYYAERGTGVYKDHPLVKGFNLLASGATAFGSLLENSKLKNQELWKVQQSLQPRYYDNMEASGLNNIPIYTKYGGGEMYPYGGGPLTSEGAKEMLRDDSAHGHKLTAKQKRYFGYIAGGGKPKKEDGGCVDCEDKKAGGKNWIPKNLKKGRCAHPGDSNCPEGSPQYNLAMTFKKHHGFHKQDGGYGKAVEAEGGEVYQTPQGQIKKINDNQPSHEQGGVEIKDAKRILEDTSTSRKDKASKLLKLTPTKVKDMFDFKPKSPVSHAKAFELANEENDKFRKKVQDANDRIGDKPDLDILDVNAVKLNIKTMQKIPKPQEVFDPLFQHQEQVKRIHGIKDNGDIKRGKYQVGGISTYEGARTRQGAIRPDKNFNNFNFKGGLPALIKAWEDAGYDMSGVQSAAQFQGRTYDILMQTPEGKNVLREMWKSGNTAQGLQKGILRDKYPNGDFRGANLSDQDLEALKGGYIDNLLGSRTITPAVTTTSEGNPVAPKSNLPLDTSTNTNLSRLSQPQNKFHEPTYWYDLAPGILSLTDSLTREPELYNPVDLHQLRYKLLDPTTALNANQADYNAVAQQLGNPATGQGIGAANAANLTAQKYKANNEILGQYENQNAQIKNNEINYNTQVRDKQSLVDAQTRGNFYQNVLQSRDNQRMQRFKAIEDLSRVAQLKARQNASGNLLLKLSPAYNQFGDYNGYQSLFYPPVDNYLPGNTSTVDTNKPKKTIKTTTFTDPSGVLRTVRTVE